MPSPSAIGHRLLDALLYSNAFVALCAAGFSLAAYPDAGLPLRPDALTLLVGGGTWAAYLALRLEGSRRLADGGYAHRLLWVVRHRRAARACLVLGALLAAIGFAGVSSRVREALLPAALLAFAYGLPFLPVPARFRLRRRNYLKIFLIAAVWAWAGVALPFAHGGRPLAGPVFWTLLAARFTFVFAITLPFDVRDIETDRVLRLRTLPALLGEARSLHLARGLLAVSWGLGIPAALALAAAPAPVLATTGALTLATAWLVGRSTRRKDDYWFLGWLDGTLLAHAPALALGLWAG